MESGKVRAIFANSNVQTVEESTLFIWDLFVCLEFQSVTSRNGQLYLYDEIADEIERMCASIFKWIIFTNFIYVLFCSVKDSSSLSEWSSMVQTMMETGTLAPLPINQELEPIYKILLTQSVKNIVHNDGTLINFDNVIDTAISFYINYCSSFDCDVPSLSCHR